jgi:hypothetical protein
MENNNLSEGEPLSKETCFKHLYITFKSHLVNDQKKKEKFRSLTEFVVNKGIVQAVKYANGKVVFFYNKNLIPKSEFYDFISNVYSRFFAVNLPMNIFVNIGCFLFDCAGKKKDSIYMALKRHKNNEIPAPYTKFFS